MEKEFVTYNQAVALKELGFDEPCMFVHDTWGNTKNWTEDGEGEHRNSDKNASIYYSAPLKQQAILFLLNKCDDLHGAELSIEYFGDESGILKNYGGNFNSLSQAIDKLIMLANDKMP